MDWGWIGAVMFFFLQVFEMVLNVDTSFEIL